MGGVDKALKRAAQRVVGEKDVSANDDDGGNNDESVAVQLAYCGPGDASEFLKDLAKEGDSGSRGGH